MSQKIKVIGLAWTGIIMYHVAVFSFFINAPFLSTIFLFGLWIAITVAYLLTVSVLFKEVGLIAGLTGILLITPLIFNIFVPVKAPILGCTLTLPDGARAICYKSKEGSFNDLIGDIIKGEF